MTQTPHVHEPSAWKGAAAGMLAGLAASWIMNQFQSALSKAASSSSQAQDPENATTRAADALSRSVLQRDLSAKEKELAGSIVHYTFGSTMGAMYGAVADFVPAMAVGRGATFGAGLWLAADEVAVPALRLSGLPQEYPASTHFSALAAHLVYGVTLDAVRRMIRSAY